MDLVLVGFGTVGQGVAESIARKNAMIKARFDEDIKIVAAFDSHTFASNKNGLDPMELINRKIEKGKLGRTRTAEIREILPLIDYDVMVEMTPTNILDGEPGLGHIKAALSQGRHVVTSNKGPLALKFKEVSKLAKKNGVSLRFEASVGGATPVINLTTELLVCEKICSIRGILNGTSNYILDRMESESMEFEAALKEAQQMGIAEADPSYDIDGIDSACKVAILANAIMKKDVTVHDVERAGIRGITLDAINLALQENKVVRLIGEVSERGVEVSPRLIPRGHPLGIGGTRNIFQMITDLAGEVTVAGRGAGRLETASAIISDLVAILKEDGLAKKG